MPTHELLGLLLLAAGAVDAVVGFVVSQKIPDAQRASVIKLATVVGGVMMAGMGGLFYYKIIPLS